MVKTVI